MEQIHEHVTVSASQCAPPQPTTTATGATAAALQFVAVNAGFVAVHFRADFRDSCNIQLVLLSPQHEQDLKYATSTAELAFNCELLPLERRVIAYVLKVPHKRAFVRVHYAVSDVKSPTLDDLERAQQVEAAALEQKARNARESLSRIRQDWLKPGSLPDAIMVRFCDDINRFFGSASDHVKRKWLTQLFGFASLSEYDLRRQSAMRVQLCEYGTQWKHVVIDLFAPGFPIGNGLMANGVEVQDVGESVRSALKRPTDATSRAVLHDEKSSLAMSWSELFALAPRVWMQLSDHREAKRQRVKFARKRDTESRQQFQFAFGIAKLSQVAIVIQHQGGSISDAASSALEVTLESLEHDFSSSTLLTASANDAVVWSADIVESQMTTSLGSGEYILTIEIPTTKTHEDTGDDHDKLLPAHTQQNTEKNLALLFECLDQDMDGVISSTEIFTFLELHDHMELNEALVDRFMDQFGTSLDSASSSPSFVSKGLLLDDLRDVYLLLATEKDPDPSNAISDQQRRYAELIWQDLLHILLHGNTEGATEAIEAIEELRCCIQCTEQAPVVNLVVLPTSTFS
uniref:EF-hand domain-containing protein n=1 Tax=Globisporangium ultimum (strain ATCC 200006 / CBS 805.95 / DAOM BR144) TaxID=431595 RepID=K3WAC1_GLOUD